MKLAKFSVSRPVTVAILVCVLIIMSTVSLSRLGLDLYPDMKLPVGAVITSYAGAGPEEIESQISQPIEQAVGTLSNIKEIQSISQAGTSIVVIWFNWGTDMDNAAVEIREKVALIEKFLPAEADKPMVVKMDPSMMPIIQGGVSGQVGPDKLYQVAQDIVSPRLERIEGVGSVILTGGKEREVRVEVDPVKLENYGLGINQVVQALAADNFNQSSGWLEQGRRQYFVRNLQQFESIDDIKNINLFTPTGTPVRLADVAEVIDGYQEINQYTRVNGEDSIGIHIIKQSDANTVKVAERVKAELERLEQDLPYGLKFSIAFDQSEFIVESIDSVKRSIIEGAALAILVLLLFLRNIQSALIIATAIPLSIIATFILMYFGNMTLNVVTMGGLALGVGRMVDDSIVVLESIYRHRLKGGNPKNAAVTGTTEVGNAVMAATFTTIAVFLPVVFVEGIAAILFKPLALTVSIAILCSLVVSLTIIPLLSSRLLVKDMFKEEQESSHNITALGQRFGRWLDGLGEAYRKLLGKALRRRKRVVLLVIALFVGSFALVPLVGAQFMPSMDAGMISINIKMDKGSVLEETNQVITRIENMISEIPEVESFFTSVGPSGSFLSEGGKAESDSGLIMVMLVDKTERERSTEDVIEALRQRVTGIPGADIKISEMDMMSGPMGSESPIHILLKGEDMEVLKQLSKDVVEEIRKVPGTREVESSLTEGHSEVHVVVDRDKAALYGLAPAQVASSVKTAIDGSLVGRYRVKGDEVDIKVRYHSNSGTQLSDLGRISIMTPQGVQVPLSEVAEFKIEQGPSSIVRKNETRAAEITGYLAGRDLNSVNKDIAARLDNMGLPEGYTYEFAGQAEQMKDSFESLSLALLLAVVLVYAVMAIQYESFFTPFVIMFSVPAAFIGVVASLALTGRTFDVTSFVGCIMLVGIVVSNAIVIVDYMGTLRREGMERNAAIMEAGAVRLRPVLMTTFTTVLGLVPLALGFGQGGESGAGMATVVIGGLLVSMLVTLVLVPVIYTIFDDWGRKIGGLFSRKKSSESVPV